MLRLFSLKNGFDLHSKPLLSTLVAKRSAALGFNSHQPIMIQEILCWPIGFRSLLVSHYTTRLQATVAVRRIFDKVGQVKWMDGSRCQIWGCPEVYVEKNLPCWKPGDCGMHFELVQYGARSDNNIFTFQSPQCGAFWAKTLLKTFLMSLERFWGKLLWRISMSYNISFSSRTSSTKSQHWPCHILTLILFRSVWTLHTGKHRTSGEPVSIFVCDSKSGASNTQLDVARLLLTFK